MMLLTSIMAFSMLFLGVGIEAAEFSFTPPGDLYPSGQGKGYTGKEVLFRNMRFPLEAAPAYLNSQVYGAGGQHGPGGEQGDAVNYSYPWHDNFCEPRSWTMQMCPSGKGHQGQDIRPSSYKPNHYWAVAAESGVIAHIGSYSVTLQTKNGTLYRYLHLNMNNLAVKPIEAVTAGQKIGLVSNFFDGAPTTLHLHFDIKTSVIINGKPVAVFVSPYSSLIESYKRLLSEQNNVN